MEQDIYGLKFYIIRHFFEPDATVDNKIPVVNKNLSSSQVIDTSEECKITKLFF